MNDPIVSTAPKSLKRYMREATRLEKIDPNIAYYCRLHGAKEAMSMNPRPADWLNTVMSKIEATKPADVQTNREAHLDSIEEMAMNAFGHADDVDRAGNANKKTAMAFNTAGTLLQVLQGCRGEAFSEELEHKKKYALWKTTDILKCIKQGIRPQPGPPGGEEAEAIGMVTQKKRSAPSSDFEGERKRMKLNDEDTGSVLSINSILNQHSPESERRILKRVLRNRDSLSHLFVEPAPAPTGPGGSNPFAPRPASGGFSPMAPTQPMQPTNPAPVSNFVPPGHNHLATRGDNFEQKVHACSKAEATMKHAFSAMRFNDVDTAVAKLEETLMKLRPYQNS